MSSKEKLERLKRWIKGLE